MLIVFDLDGAVLANGHLYRGRITRKSLIDGVVHNLPDQVVKAPNVCIADVHRRSYTHGLETLEDGDRLCAVVGRALGLVVLCHVFSLKATDWILSDPRWRLARWR